MFAKHFLPSNRKAPDTFSSRWMDFASDTDFSISDLEVHPLVKRNAKAESVSESSIGV